ncbi:hypothetical protein [Parasitella parasitica]|uniref:Uncharacterized protein n=1 Tax=Parasitella parasitica TaxID=35722 RepID=A0A0B7NRT4_9FUNG|nr:hypothetical protein [Parasitella parasitica]
MYSRKRYYQEDNDVDDDEEDIWEREASVGSLSNRKNPPNSFSKNIDILDAQYEILQKHEHDLQLELQSLQTSLHALEQNQVDEETKLKQIESEYLAAVQEAIAFYESQLKDTQDIDLDETITIHNDTAYLKTDALLNREIKRILVEWDSIFVDEKLEDTNAIIKATAHQYRKTGFDVVDLITQISGYEARIQSLNRDRAKLNSLPQILPILRSETERYASDMKETTKKLERLEADVIRPYLEKLAVQHIFCPLYASFIENMIRLTEDYFKNAEYMYNLCIKQRACQQFTTLLYEKDAAIKIQKLHSLKLLAIEQPDHIQKVPPNVSEDEEHFVAIIKGLLKTVLMQIGKDTASLTLDEQIEALQQHGASLKQKWQEDFQSCHDAATELALLHKRLSASLHSQSRTSDKLFMVPKPYSNLQEELEFRTIELQNVLSALQKVKRQYHQY